MLWIIFLYIHLLLVLSLLNNQLLIVNFNLQIWSWLKIPPAVVLVAALSVAYGLKLLPQFRMLTVQLLLVCPLVILLPNTTDVPPQLLILLNDVSYGKVSF